ncbi:Acetate kinase [Aquisphaera giovannonii]|uniref:Acetate kinase n=1 Tax=Aquisphaera giovannonii TaxID=406548 RepID=A0A5B9W9U9_9BACT|nr:acetate/propionate family kinase [Aquisphaera giovannonii]QEH36620.1 Acetate kinase [Aquisphaera giovannonii]
MKILVANLGSTSFKYRLFDVSDPSEPVLARGGIERIGSPTARVVVKTTRGERESARHVEDHGDAVQLCLEQLTDPEIGVLADPSEVSAIGFKAVHARNLTGVHLVDDEVLAAMEAFADVAPAHNPPYTKAMRMLRGRFPKLPLVAAFETGFHRTIPEARQRYAIPDAWATELGIRKWGFHGASHRYISWRVPELLGRKDLKVISCHLGGSSSLAAIDSGRSVACSLGMSPQTGLPHNNRVGEFDVFALPPLLRETGKTLEEILDILANQSGLQGLCEARDLRDIEAAADKGDPCAKLAIDVFVDSIRHYLGAFMVALGGLDVIAFTGGIGENSSRIREEVCRDLAWFGIELDPTLNASGEAERKVSSAGSRVQVWTVPTNEELVVARQSRTLLDSGKASMD